VSVRDAGVDVIAQRDPLGLEAPVIKLQKKRSTSPMGGPVVQNLGGKLAPGGTDDRGLFVTLGSFSKDVLHIKRTRQDLRLRSPPAGERRRFANGGRAPARHAAVSAASREKQRRGDQRRHSARPPHCVGRR